MDKPGKHHTPELLQLCYYSRSQIVGSLDQIAWHIRNLLTVSRQNNAADGITGALLYNGEVFAQVLEGPRGAVEHRFARIAADPRHTDVVELSRESTRRRLFAAWSMAYADAHSFRTLPDSAIDLEAIIATGQSRPGFLLNLLRDVMEAQNA